MAGVLGSLTFEETMVYVGLLCMGEIDQPILKEMLREGKNPIASDDSVVRRAVLSLEKKGLVKSKREGRKKKLWPALEPYEQLLRKILKDEKHASFFLELTQPKNPEVCRNYYEYIRFMLNGDRGKREAGWVYFTHYIIWVIINVIVVVWGKKPETSTINTGGVAKQSLPAHLAPVFSEIYELMAQFLGHLTSAVSYLDKGKILQLLDKYNLDKRDFENLAAKLLVMLYMYPLYERMEQRPS